MHTPNLALENHHSINALDQKFKDSLSLYLYIGNVFSTDETQSVASFEEIDDIVLMVHKFFRLGCNPCQSITST